MYYYYSLYKIGLLLISFSLLAACDNLPLKQFAPITPQISLTNLKLREVNLLEQNFELQLELTNPNSFALPIANLDYAIYLNGKEFFKGVSNAPFSLPAKETKQIGIEVVTNLLDIFEQLRAWQDNLQKNVNYRLVGQMKLTNWAPALTFEEMGNLPLNFSR